MGRLESDYVRHQIECLQSKFGQLKREKEWLQHRVHEDSYSRGVEAGRAEKIEQLQSDNDVLARAIGSLWAEANPGKRKRIEEITREHVEATEEDTPWISAAESPWKKG
jgi:hypothetical protein